MCMIFCAREGVPSLSIMERAEKSNDDGGGIAWIQQTEDKKGTEVCWKKHITAKEIHEIINDLNLAKFLPEFPFVVHFRAASSGGVHEKLCQPFAVEKNVSCELEGKAKEVLFHNGTYGAWDDMMKTMCFAGGVKVPAGPWNDSRALTWLAFNRGVGALYLTNHGGFSQGSGGRIALLHSDGNLLLLGNGWIKGEQEGVVQSGTVSDTFCSAARGHYSGNFEKKISHISRPLKDCSLYEESDKVLIYSTKEYENILKEIESEQTELTLQ